jgi:hypothetical protein
MSNDKKIQLKFLVGAIALMAFIFAMQGCADDPQPVKTRVATVPQQLEQAQQSAADAKAAADRADATLKQIQDGINKLDSQWKNSDGTMKLGHPEITGVGTVTNVAFNKIQSASGESSDKYVFTFTFAERAGFTKEFKPVCANQSIPVNSTVILNFHWADRDPGCYQIDGYTVTK